MDDREPESSPFFKTAMVSMGIFTVVALSPVTDTFVQRYFQEQEQEQERKKEEARSENPICKEYRGMGLITPEWADCRKLRKL